MSGRAVATRSRAARSGACRPKAGRSGRLTHADRVLAHLRRQNQPLSAYQILDDLRDDGVTAAVTVYRALDQLLAAGQVHRIESFNAWVACCDPNHQEAAVFEICGDCGAVTEYVGTSLAQDLAALSKHTGFLPEHSVIEIRGCCRECRPDAPSV